MGSSHFDYPYTCHIIDREIDNFKESVEETLKELIEDICPYIDSSKNLELSKYWSDEIFSKVEDCFEKTRSSNSDLRDYATKQVDELIDKITELEDEIKYSNDTIIDQEDTIQNLKDTIKDLQDTIQENESEIIILSQNTF